MGGQRKKKLSQALPTLMRAYSRTSRRGGLDPNDRHYDRKMERIVKRMPAEELDGLMHDGDAADDDGIPSEPASASKPSK